MFYKLMEMYKNRNYYYHKFLLERYLQYFRFTRIKYINNMEDFYRDREHFINYQNEKIYLKKYFDKR